MKTNPTIQFHPKTKVSQVIKLAAQMGFKLRHVPRRVAK